MNDRHDRRKQLLLCKDKLWQRIAPRTIFMDERITHLELSVTADVTIALKRETKRSEMKSNAKKYLGVIIIIFKYEIKSSKNLFEGKIKSLDLLFFRK